ncbi:hypothetical protein AQZ49_10960 [Novosphingobium sp. FSW06-99]|nr:hypothetical protein AQZ49_10960 [Novosphingobium sp. FSW06-99]
MPAQGLSAVFICLPNLPMDILAPIHAGVRHSGLSATTGKPIDPLRLRYARSAAAWPRRIAVRGAVKKPILATNGQMPPKRRGSRCNTCLA